MMDVICIGLMCWALGMWTAFFLYGWFEGQSDSRANIPWRKELDTSINWDLQAHRRR
jgi:hypothetical protein